MPRKGLPLRVSDVMVKEVITAKKDTPIKEIARLMHENKIGSVVIADEAGKPVGIVTERDIVYVCARGLTGDTPAFMIMTEDPAVIQEDALLIDAMEKMRSLNVRHLPVVNRKGALVGLISFRDLIDLAATLLRLR